MLILNQHLLLADDAVWRPRAGGVWFLEVLKKLAQLENPAPRLSYCHNVQNTATYDMADSLGWEIWMKNVILK